MEVARLTARLRRTVLSLPPQERLSLQEDILASLSPDRRVGNDRMEDLREAMRQIAGVDVLSPTRERRNVEARTIFAYVLRVEGYSQCDVARFLQKNHTTVWYMEKEMASAFAHPKSFPTLITTYNKFIQAIV